MFSAHAISLPLMYSGPLSTLILSGVPPFDDPVRAVDDPLGAQRNLQQNFQTTGYSTGNLAPGPRCSLHSAHHLRPTSACQFPRSLDRHEKTERLIR